MTAEKAEKMEPQTLTPAESTDLSLQLKESGLEFVSADSFLIQWSSGSEQHPRNWHMRKKVYNVAFILLYEAFEAAMSTVGASAAVQAREELGLDNTIAYLALTTVFIIGEGLAGLVFPPLSESFGRKIQYIISSALFCVVTCLSAIPSLPAILITRLLAGFVGGVPPCISPGSLEDIFTPQAQTWSIFAWATSSNIGLVVGPIVSGYITDSLGWQWVFYLGSMFAFGIFVMALFFFESRPSLLLAKKVQSLHKASGFTVLRTSEEDHRPPFRLFVRQVLTRPLRLLATEPIIIICSLLNGLAFALIYALTEALPIVYHSFGVPTVNTSLAFIPVVIGVLLSVLLRVYDHVRLSTRIRTGTVTRPEHKITSLLISAPLLCIGLWLFSWTIPPAVTNITLFASMAALIPIGLAANDFDAVIAIYLVDVYGSFAASAFASVTWTRAIASVTFTLATDKMFRSLGANVAGSICASGAVAVCAGAIILRKWGAVFRRRSPFASGQDTLITHEDASLS